jgi:hypothetical protein
MERLIINCKENLLFFYSHSARSKYFIENLDFIVKVCHLLSPLMAMRVKEGAFVNIRGGCGQNIEADLAQEHSVRSRKDAIRLLGSNKNETSIMRVTSAADALKSVVTTFDTSMKVPHVSGRHGRLANDTDSQTISSVLRECRPFKQTQRVIEGFIGIPPNSFFKINNKAFRDAVKRNISNICRGQSAAITLTDLDVV